MTAPALFDPGLQPERTTLAWRRTALAVVVGSLVSIRVLPPVLGAGAWYAPGLIGLAFAAWMWWAARRRHAAFCAQLGAAGEPRQSGAAPLLAVAMFTSAAGAVALVAVLQRGL